MQLDLGERQAADKSLGDVATRTRIGKASYLLATREQLNTVPEPCRLTACTDPRRGDFPPKRAKKRVKDLGVAKCPTA
jgi:hypothetical protein